MCIGGYQINHSRSGVLILSCYHNSILPIENFMRCTPPGLCLISCIFYMLSYMCRSVPANTDMPQPTLTCHDGSLSIGKDLTISPHLKWPHHPLETSCIAPKGVSLSCMFRFVNGLKQGFNVVQAIN